MYKNTVPVNKTQAFGRKELAKARQFPLYSEMERRRKRLAVSPDSSDISKNRMPASHVSSNADAHLVSFLGRDRNERMGVRNVGIFVAFVEIDWLGGSGGLEGTSIDPDEKWQRYRVS